ncbi:MAG: NAD(P)H-hydrate dehydratase [Thermodesulfobacteriota bacterium]|nr:NAD(P)H-hydrate dehydratase [Thermodesulfobacteriota bacterium]
MFAIAGTVPIQDFPLVAGEVFLEDDSICIGERRIPVNRGTPALLSAAVKACEVLDQPAPFGYLVGDIGLGEGSRSLYEYLTKDLRQSGSRSKPGTGLKAITFHYLQPDVDWHNRILFAIKEMIRRPILIADAGFMYAAKMSGKASKYDLFTPDIGELAFLADEEAPHPFYTRGFILHEEDRISELIDRVYQHNNAACCLLVKGKQDYVADLQGIQATIDSPVEEAMEAMGGTGDTLTGIVTALVGSGMEVTRAAIIAARVNRLAGYYAKPTPATQVMEIIQHIPKALAKVLSENEKGEVWIKQS